MAAIRDVVHRVPWTRQPQFPVPIDWGNPVTVGLQAAFSPVTGRMVDTSQNGSTPPSADTGTQQIGIAGISRAYTGGTKSTFANSPRYGLASAMTLVVVCDVNTLTNYGALISCENQPDVSGWELRVGNGPTDSVILASRSTSGGYYQYKTGANRINAGSKNNFVAVTYPSALVESTPSFYVNGVAYAAVFVGNTSTGAQLASTLTLDIGARAAGTTQLDGAVLFAGLWNRALAAGEIESLRGNTSQVYLGQSRRIWTPTAGGIPTLSASTFKPATVTSTGWTPRVTAT